MTPVRRPVARPDPSELRDAIIGRQAELARLRAAVDQAHALLAQVDGAIRHYEATLAEVDVPPSGERIGPSEPQTTSSGSVWLLVVSPDARDRGRKPPAAFARVVRATLETHGGFEVGERGDDLVIAFRDRRAAEACATRIDQQLAHLSRREGLDLKARMGLHGGKAIDQALRFVASDGGRAASAERPEAMFRRERSCWTIGWKGKTIVLPDLKGLRYLAVLLAQPVHAIPALHLVAGQPVAGGSAGVALDARAKAEYRARLGELDRELDDAEQCRDAGRIDRLRAEREALLAELTAALGINGRDRVAASDAERARLSVTQRIRAAIDRIAALHPDLGDHLRRNVRTGTACVYTVGIRWMT